MNKGFLLVLLLAAFACTPANTSEIEALSAELASTKTQLEEMNNQSTYVPGLIHNVFFWLKDDISEADKAAFIEGVKLLGGINTVRKMYIGPPAATEDRDVIDNSYGIALLVHFDDIEGQNAYQVDPIHLKFIEDHKDKWTKVVVYDNNVLK